MKRLVYCISISLALIQSSAHAYEPRLEKLSEHCYAFFTGDGGPNAGFIVTEEGVVVIDTLDTLVHAEDMLAEIRKITQAPVYYIVNTNWHFQHVTGNQVFVKQLRAIIGHEKTRLAMGDQGQTERRNIKQNYTLAIEQHQRTLREEALSAKERADVENLLADAQKSEFAFDRTRLVPPNLTLQGHVVRSYSAKGRNYEVNGSFHFFPGGPAGHEMIFSTHAGAPDLELVLGGVRIHVMAMGQAFTDGDLIVHVPEEKVVFLGGLLTTQSLPWLDGSHITKWPKTLDAALRLEFGKALGGEGVIAGKDDVIAFKGYLVDLYSAVKDQWDQGTAKDDIRWKIDLSAYENWNNYKTYLRYNIEQVYDQVEALRRP